MLGLEFSRQIVFNGLVSGLAVGVLAMGVVLIYRASRVINFAVGALGVLSASLLAVLTVNYGWPFWPAAIVSLAAGAALAAAVELTVITRLFTAPRVVVLVATIGIAQLGELLRLALPTLEGGFTVRYPLAISGQWELAGVRVSGAALSVVIVAPVTAAALTWFITRTAYGRAIRAAAANADLARLFGISPKLVSTLTWTIAGVLAAVALILLAGLNVSAAALSTLGSATLVQVLAAALIGRLSSFPIALAGGVVIGIARTVLTFSYPASAGLFDAVLFLAIVVATWLVVSSQTDEDDSFAFVPTERPIPAALADRWWARGSGRLLVTLALVAAACLPLVVLASSRQFLYGRVVVIAVIAMSMVVLAGWAGQISLGQAALAGVGGLTTGALVSGRDLGVGVVTEWFVVPVPELPFLAAVPIAALVSGLVAVAIGLGALRVRGFYLAIVTLGFALFCQQYLWTRPFLSGGESTVSVERGALGPVELSSQRNFFYLALLVLAVILVLLSRMRATGVGRRWLAVRDNATAAAAYGVSPTRVKLQAFAVSGVVAGMGGALLAGLLTIVGLREEFQIQDSIDVVAAAVIGGVGTVTGPILGAVWVVGLPAIWPTNAFVPLITSSVGLLILLMYFPGGLSQLGSGLRVRVFDWYANRLPKPSESRPAHSLPPSIVLRGEHRDLAPLLRASGLSVAFGGLVAVNDVSVEVRPGEVVGLIGTNGAGKSTLMNAISGAVGSSGSVKLGDRELNGLPAHRRAAQGLGRTFQSARLFPELTVQETLEVAVESHTPTSFLAAVSHLPSGYRRNRAQAAHAAEITDFLGLGAYTDRTIAELSTGTRRILELGTLLALDARVLCLDEPTGGIAQREVEAFAPLLLSIQRELAASLLVIEHDMPMIMGISDRIYCLEAGVVIAHGDPETVRSNPKVIASYLGTDDRAIQRSDAGSGGR